MKGPRTAKLFRNGASQAVRLPADFRFAGDQVYVSRDPATGGVLLSERPIVRSWDEFYAFMGTFDIPEDYMAERPMNTLPDEKDIFGEDV